MALWYAMAMAHRLSSCGGNDMDEKKSAPAEIETVTITMSRPVAEAVAKACEMYLRLHLGQFEDLIDELCMAKFYAALENDSFADEEERDEIFHISIDRRNIMQEEVDKLYKRYVYAPNFVIYGSMDANDLRSLLDEGYEKFCEYVERYEREKRRTQYGT